MINTLALRLKFLLVVAKLFLWLISGTRNLRRAVFVKRFLSDYKAFLKAGGEITHTWPILYDFTETAGVAKGAYFHQDLLVAHKIFRANPKRHIDVGSRVDGFVAHVAAFRAIEVLDVRVLPNSENHSIRFLQADLMDGASVSKIRSDSVSCLHAIEHFGLGRYSDPINPDGHKIGFNNLLKILEPGGTLYIGIPIGRRNEVYFNAHRIFTPEDILSWSSSPGQVELLTFDYIDDQGDLHRNWDLRTNPCIVSSGCGVYTFKKNSL
jgi:hypothetical protein